MVKPKQEGPHGTPEFIHILSIDDKMAYEKLKEDVGSTKHRYNRFHRISTLKESFEKIRGYCQEKEEDKWKRYLVCGICWFGDYLAINTRQLRFLISKSKSTINDALLKMGYSTVSIKGEPGSLLIENIPFLFGNQTEFRKWSIRKNKKSDTCKNDNNVDCKCCNIFLSDDEDMYKDDIDFLDNYFKSLENNNKNETDNEFTFVNFNDNVDENFDFEFGYEESCITNSYDLFSSDKNNKIFDNNIINYKFEESTKIY